MNRQYESMTRGTVGDRTVRVWATETELTTGPRRDIEEAIAAVNTEFMDGEHRFPNKWTCERVAAVLDALPDIAAYEILDTAGNGALVYPDWK